MIDRSVQLLDEQYGNDPRFIANALIPISGRYMDMGNTDKELAALQKAEGIARRLAPRRAPDVVGVDERASGP